MVVSASQSKTLSRNDRFLLKNPKNEAETIHICLGTQKPNAQPKKLSRKGSFLLKRRKTEAEKNSFGFSFPQSKQTPSLSA